MFSSIFTRVDSDLALLVRFIYNYYTSYKFNINNFNLDFNNKVYLISRYNNSKNQIILFINLARLG